MALTLQDLVSGLGGTFSGRSSSSPLAGLGLIGAGSFFDREPGFATEARQSLRNLFTNPPSAQFNQPLAPQLQTSSDFLTNFINAPADPLAPGGVYSRYLPQIGQQESDVLEKLKQRYSSFFPGGISAPSGAELSSAGQFSARAAQNRQALIADLLRDTTSKQLQASSLIQSIPGIQDIYTQNQIRAAEDLLNYAKPNPLGTALSLLGTQLAFGGQGGAFGSTGGTGNVLTQLAKTFGLDLSRINLPGTGGEGGNTLEGVLRTILGLPPTGGTPGAPAGAPAGTTPPGPTPAPGTMPSATTPDARQSFQQLVSQLLTGLGGLQGTPGGISGEAPSTPGLLTPTVIGGSLGTAAGTAIAGTEAGAALGSVAGPLGAVIGAGLGALAGKIGQSQAHKAQKEFFRRQDLDSQADQVQEIGSFFTQALSTLGMDTTAFQQFVSQKITESPGPGDEQSMVAAQGGQLLLQAIQKAFPQVQSLNDVPGLRAQYVDFLIRNTFSASNSIYGGGPAINAIEGGFSTAAGF